MTKRPKSFAGLDVILKAVTEQKEKILALAELKNSSIICAQQYQQDITDLKRCIEQFRIAIRSTTKFHKAIPLSNDKETDLPKTRTSFAEFTTIKQHTLNEVICSAVYSPNGNYYAFSTFLKLYLYDSNTNNCIQATALPFDPLLAFEKVTRKVCFSKDSNFIAVCAADFSVFIFQVPSLNHSITLQKNSNCAASIAFFNDSKRMITSGNKGTVNIWSIPKFEIIKSISFNENSSIVSILISSDDSTVLILSADGSLGIFDSSFNQPPNIVSTDSSFIYSAVLSRSSTFLAVASRQNDVKIFTLVGGVKLEKSLSGHLDLVVCVEFSPESKFLFSGSKDETLRVWDIENGESLGTLGCHSNTVLGISHHPTKNMFISCSGDGTVCVTIYKIVK